ncbi:MAG: hypothetical protein ACREJM_03780, partial [Candidatus Saccharimonadales bacterium]
LTFKDGRWYICSWASHLYQLPPDADVAEVMTAAIGAAKANAQRNYYDIDPAVRNAFSLTEIRMSDFDELTSEDDGS